MKEIKVELMSTSYGRTTKVQFLHGYSEMYVRQKAWQGQLGKCELEWNQSDFSFWQAGDVAACIALLTKAHEVMVDWDANREWETE